ncbi:hypothetical protein ACIA8I_13910 [Streptomyces rishiriensis]|uniref:hypothetical protein n=1 Tax=Streptomyces rishiriensis TaxID=68264 RepID=UPI0037A0B6F2
MALRLRRSLTEAQERHEDFFRQNPSLNDRHWLLASFDALAKSHRTVEGLFDPAHNPLFEVLASYEAATALLAFWRERGADGEVVHDFTDPDLDTRFLGDLYQDQFCCCPGPIWADHLLSR